VKLLFDQNLSWRLIDHRRDAFPESVHVTSEGLDTATDDEIWEFAGANDFVVVSKDSDFRQLAFLHGPPPKVVWLRVGNASTVEILEVILDHVEVVESFVDSEDEALLALPFEAVA
jgi:predicted nuclease of predicted toxin-antitoxin system